MAHPDFDNFEWPITSGHRVVGVSFVHVSFGWMKFQDENVWTGGLERCHWCHHDRAAGSSHKLSQVSGALGGWADEALHISTCHQQQVQHPECREDKSLTIRLRIWFADKKIDEGIQGHPGNSMACGMLGYLPTSSKIRLWQCWGPKFLRRERVDVMQRLCQKGLDLMMLDAGQGARAGWQNIKCTRTNYFWIQQTQAVKIS